jgi:hypothetical protein
MTGDKDFKRINKVFGDYSVSQGENEPAVNKVNVKWKKDYNPEESCFLSKYNLEVTRGGGNECRRFLKQGKNIVKGVFDNLKVNNSLQNIYDKTYATRKIKKIVKLVKYFKDKEMEVNDKRFDVLFQKISENLSIFQDNVKYLEVKFEINQFYISFIEITYSIIFENLNLIYETCSNGFKQKIWWEIFCEIDNLELNIKALQIICTFVRKIWNMINRQNKQDYVFLLDVLLPELMRVIFFKFFLILIFNFF